MKHLYQVVPGITLKDPVLLLVRLMASKKPDSLMEAMMLSEKVETVVPRNFIPFINLTAFNTRKERYSLD